MKRYFKVLAISCVIMVINYICDPEAQKTRRQQFKEGVCWMWGVQCDFASPFAQSGLVQFLESSEGCTNDSLSSLDYPP